MMKNIEEYVAERFNLFKGLRYWDFYTDACKRRKEYVCGTQSKWDQPYAINAGFAVVQTMISDILTNTPPPWIVGMDETGRRNQVWLEMAWKHIWVTSNTEREIYKIVEDACVLGSGYGLETWEIREKKKRVPNGIVDGKMTFKEEKVEEYVGNRLQYIPYENVYTDGYEVADAQECVITEVLQKNAFKSQYENMLTQDELESVMNGTGLWCDTTYKGVVTEQVLLVHYYNKAENMYIKTANGVHINRVSGEQDGISPIPYTHWELPIVQYVCTSINGRPNGMGVLEITENARYMVATVRENMVRQAQMQMGMLRIDRNSELTEQDIIFDSKSLQVLSADAGEVEYMTFNSNMQGLQYLENKATEDIVIDSGIDYRAQFASPYDTATNTARKNQAQEKRIRFNIRHNATNFWKRWAVLRLANMQMVYGDGGRKLTVAAKGVDMSLNWESRAIQNGYGVFTIPPKMFKGKFMVLPDMDNMVNYDKDSMYNRMKEISQIFGNATKPDGSPVINMLNLAKDTLQYAGLNADMLTSSTDSTKSPDEHLKEVGLTDPTKPELTNPQDPNFIPPAQRSGARSGIGAVGGGI